MLRSEPLRGLLWSADGGGIWWRQLVSSFGEGYKCLSYQFNFEICLLIDC